MEANLDTETVPKKTTLRIPGAQRSDTGEYELVLSNEAGSDKVPIKITVMGMYSFFFVFFAELFLFWSTHIFIIVVCIVL